MTPLQTYQNEHGETIDLATGRVLPPADPTLVRSEDGKSWVRLNPAEVAVAKMLQARDEAWERDKAAQQAETLRIQRKHVDDPPLLPPGLSRLARLVYRLLQGEPQDAHDLEWLKNYVTKHKPFDDWGDP